MKHCAGNDWDTEYLMVSRPHISTGRGKDDPWMQKDGDNSCKRKRN